MVDIDAFQELDKVKGGFMLLLIIYENSDCSKMDLKRMAKEQEIGGTAFNTAYRIIIEQGLARNSEQQNGKQILTRLTKKGTLIAEQVERLRSFAEMEW